MPTVSYLTLITGIPQKTKWRKEKTKERRIRLQDGDNPLQTPYELFPFRPQVLHSHALILSSPASSHSLTSLSHHSITLHSCISRNHHLQSTPLPFPILITRQPCTTTSRVSTWITVHLLTSDVLTGNSMAIKEYCFP